MGKELLVSDEAKPDLDVLLFAHKTHPAIVKLWEQDFRQGLLFPPDFLVAEIDGTYYPDRYIQHAFEIYFQVMGFVPKIWEGEIDG